MDWIRRVDVHRREREREREREILRLRFGAFGASCDELTMGSLGACQIMRSYCRYL